MSAYELGYLFGALLMVALLGWVAISAFRRGTTAGRVVGAVALLLVVGSATSSARWFLRTRPQSEGPPRFVAGCLAACRQELRSPGKLCEEQCSCFERKLLGKYTDAELSSWLEVGQDEGPAAARRRLDISAAIPECGRQVIGARFEQLCDEDCAKEGACPARLCSCMREQLVSDPRFTDYAWLSAVALTDDETPQAAAWQRKAAAVCVPAAPQ